MSELRRLGSRGLTSRGARARGALAVQRKDCIGGGSMGSRAKSSGFATSAVEEGFATVEELERIANGWKGFVEADDGWFGLLHGEILCWKRSI